MANPVFYASQVLLLLEFLMLLHEVLVSMTCWFVFIWSHCVNTKLLSGFVQPK